MWSQFLWENVHFAINILTSLAFFSIFWLYLDAWSERKTLKDGLKIIGFFLLSVSFLMHAVLIESPNFTISILNVSIYETISIILKNIGYIFLISGLISDPLISKPKISSLALVNLAAPYLLAPVLAILSAWLYLRRATIGLENHTKTVSFAFFLFAFSEVLNVSSLFVNNPNVDIFRLVSPFGPIWIFAHATLLTGSIVLIIWAFSYLLKRINTQLFIIFTTTILSIFLLTTTSFTFLLLKNLSDETLLRLKTDVAVLSYALDTKKSEALASGSILSQNASVTEAIKNKDRKILADASEKLLLDRKLSSVIVVDEVGQVLARGEERDRIGDSLSSDNLLKRALIGESVSSIQTQDSAIVPNMIVKAAVPIKSDDKVIGVAITSLSLDNNFLDGVKKVTGLEVSIYGEDTLSATTISDLHQTTRPIGIKNSNKTVSNDVLVRGVDYSGIVSLLNTSYFAVYHPLKDADNVIVGMLMAGRPSTSIFDTAGKSIELTFVVTIALIALSILPSFYISKYISNQLS